jgi:hypothetical protein
MNVLKISVLVVLILFAKINFAQQEVTFTAKDGLKITAYQYVMDSSYSFILLFHQEGYSKGEYKETARKLLKLKYNVLAVDLRTGGTINFVPNSTAIEAKTKGFPSDFLSSRTDIEAAIDYAFSIKNKPVILFGSAFSASLCLLEGKDNDKVKAVVAFSPGEYFEPDFEVQEKIAGYNKKVFVAGTQLEEKYIKLLMSGVSEKNKTIFIPKEGAGTQGSKALWRTNPTQRGYWLNLFLYFKQI